MGNRCAGKPAKRKGVRSRYPAIHDEALAADAHLEGQAAGVGSDAIFGRRRAAGVDDHRRTGGIDALVAGVRRVRRPCASHVVVGEDRGQLFGGGVARAVEMRERAVAFAEEAKHRHHPVDCRDEDARGLGAAGGEGLAERQKIDERLEEGARVAADVAAIGKNLGDEFEVEATRSLLQEARLVGRR